LFISWLALLAKLYYTPYYKHPNYICQEANNKLANHLSIQITPDFERRYPNSSAQATECAMNLVLTADLLLKRISSLLQPFDLSPGSGLVLSILADSESPLPPNQIAERLIISRATVTGLIDSLERRGYVKRLPHQTDRRMLLVELTDSGRQVASAFRPVVHQHQKVWLEALSEGEQQQLVDSLQRLQATLMESDK
jgi:DNA-binding MarR family transcriptional regulator